MERELYPDVQENCIPDEKGYRVDDEESSSGEFWRGDSNKM
jgi:hypothetical protein